MINVNWPLPFSTIGTYYDKNGIDMFSKYMISIAVIYMYFFQRSTIIFVMPIS